MPGVMLEPGLQTVPAGGESQQHQPRIAAAWLVVPCLAADGLMAPVMRSFDGGPPGDGGAAIALGVVGCVLAQGNLLAAWLAWGEGPFLRRLWAHWKIAIGLYLVWFMGLALAAVDDFEFPAIAATVALGVPLISLAAQWPLWLVRQWLGWRLVRDGSEPPPGEPPLSIRDLMLATLIVATALALARLAPVWENASALWAAWGIASTVASLISAIALLPAGALLLRSRRFSRGLIWSCLYAAAWIAFVWFNVAVLRWYGVLLPPRALFVGLSSLMFTFAATVVLTAAIARDRGYRLTSGRQR